ncbi:hypothetical protein P8936_13815 [Edaphobacter paludis]|uniref:Uncharacterized protein n=1 Tax=Edaphobacter paludis TaxID=3035702 RepID=A0AAU7CWW1_9BACT
MPVPVRTYAISRTRQLLRLMLLVLLASVQMPAWATGPSLRIPLDSLGFQPQSTQFLLAGSSMLTVNYVDNQHLLFTFGVHRLMQRIANDPPDDEDRMVEAVLIELPSGRVLARTDWRLHDSGQYLWGLGHGRFLLRVHDTLTTFAPMANLASGQPFAQRGFLTTDRRIGAVLLSPESDLMIVETAERMPPVPAPRPPLFGPAPKPAPDPVGRPGDPDPVALSFYRLAMPGRGDVVQATLAGVAHSSHFGDVAAIGAGHIGVVDEGRQEWAFDFRPFHGKAKELAPFGSTCDPTPRFVSSSEFVAFGCHGGQTPMVLGGFNMRGEQMWEQNLFGDYVGTSMTFAPESGRFALGRVLGEAATVDLAIIPEQAYTAQNVVVYQTESGKQLLHVDCSPIARAGQNFALAPDGMSLAVIRDGAIAIYNLPPLSKKDQIELKEARALVPEENIQPIDFAEPTSPSATTASSSADEPAGSKAAPATSANVPKTTSISSAAPAPVASQPAPNAAVSGDAAPEQPRKPPTLYTLPGDKGNDQGNTAERETK